MAECCIQLTDKVRNLTGTVATLSRTVDKLVAAKVERGGIAALNDHPALVVSVYIISFLTWGVLSNLDFISEKWRSIRETRKQGRRHLVASLVPMVYVGFYAYVQLASEDYKEMMAAVVAMMLALYHAARTAWGLVQVQAFREWCGDAIACMKAFRMDGYGIFEDEDNYDGLLKVNNTLVDNEFTGTDLSVQVDKERLKSIEEMFSSRRWKASKWLKTEQSELCTVRWAASFLCVFGHCWTFAIGWSKAEAESWIEENVAFLRNLTCVTHRITDKNGKQTFLSSASRDLQLVGAYEHSIGDYFPFYTMKAFSLEFENTLSSYPTSNLGSWELHNRRDVSIYLVDLLLMMKYVGASSAESMVAELSRRKLLPTRLVEKHAWELLACQNGNRAAGSDISTWVNRLFPLNLTTCSLWDTRTNWRVLEASAHSDIDFNLLTPHHYMISSLHSSGDSTEIEAGASCIFEYTRNRALEAGIEFCGKRFLGVTMAAVRAVLGEWSTTCQRSIDWSPVLPRQVVQIPIREDVITAIYRSDDDRHHFLIWDCQTALHSNLAAQLESSNDVASCAELIVLFLLALPLVDVTTVWDGSHQDSNIADLANTEEENEPSRDTLFWKPQYGPSNISVEINVDQATSTASLRLICNEGNPRFVWQDWINAAMGCMKGMEEAIEAGAGSEGVRGTGEQDETSHVKRRISRADLSRPILRIGPEHSDLDMKHLSGELLVFTGWPIFDLRIDTFEVSQWMYATGKDPALLSSRITELEEQRRACDFWEEEAKFYEEREQAIQGFDEEVKKAEEALGQIMDWNRL